jgi:formylglycine-generating enzyme required for sulfatase activity
MTGSQARHNLLVRRRAAVAVRFGVLSGVAVVALGLAWAALHRASGSPTDAAGSAAVPPPQVSTAAADHRPDWTSPTLGVLRWVPPGTFTMGSTAPSGGADEHPSHEVRLTRGFWLMEHEVTQAEWQAVMGSNPSSFSRCGGACPVEQVSWNDAQAFVAAMSLRDGVAYALPTEAQWEYAARGGASTEYAGSDDVDAVAWHGGNSGGALHAVCGKQRNGFGLCDMSGGVWEWVADWYGDYGGATTDPTGLAAGDGRVVRGGAWSHRDVQARVAVRNRLAPAFHDSFVGLRLLRPAP